MKFIKDVFFFWRRNRDSNPGWGKTPLTVFETVPFNRLGISPSGDNTSI